MSNRPERPELPELPQRPALPGLPDHGALLAEPDITVFDRIENTLFDRIAGSERARGARHRLIAAASAVVLLGAGGAAWVALASPQLRATSTYCYAAADTSAPFTQVGSPSESFDDSGTATPVPYPADRFAAALDNCAAVWNVGFFEGSFSGDTSSDDTFSDDTSGDGATDDYSSESHSGPYPADGTPSEQGGDFSDTGGESSETDAQVDDADERSVSDLVVCVRPDQVPAVFPRDAQPATSPGRESSREADRRFCLDLGLTSPPTE